MMEIIDSSPIGLWCCYDFIIFTKPFIHSRKIEISKVFQWHFHFFCVKRIPRGESVHRGQNVWYSHQWDDCCPFDDTSHATVHANRLLQRTNGSQIRGCIDGVVTSLYLFSATLCLNRCDIITVWQTESRKSKQWVIDKGIHFQDTTIKLLRCDHPPEAII